MKKMTTVFLLLTAQTLIASDTTTYEVKGMHCEGCQAMVKQQVCALPAIENCEVRLVPKKKNTGMISYSVKTGETLDEATIAATIKKAGDEYTLNTKTKKIKTH